MKAVRVPGRNWIASVILGAQVMGRLGSEPTIHLVSLADQKQAQSDRYYHDNPTQDKAAQKVRK